MTPNPVRALSTCLDMPEIKVQRLTERDFSFMREQWADCLSRSASDPLFSSWPWLFTWWENWSRRLNIELVLIGAFDSNNRLVGIGPFFLHRYVMNFGLRVKRLHLLGNAWRIGPTVRTEYTSIIADREVEDQVVKAIFHFLKGEKWDEVIFSDIEAHRLNTLNALASPISKSAGLLTRAVDYGVCINTGQNWDAWLRCLGRNTRLKLFNRRRYLRERGSLGIKNFDVETGALAFFDLLNRYHRERWGTPAFDQAAIEFHLRLRLRLEQGQQVIYRALTYNDEVVSILYDIQSGSRIYNLQSGYRQSFDSKVSLGTLHLGFAIEEAFAAEDVNAYDLLAGSGKNTFYKEHFRGERIEFNTAQFVRSPIFRLAYSHHVHLPGILRKKIKQFFRL